MFSLALKNAILLVLIILIVHILLKNYLKNKQPMFQPLPMHLPTQHPIIPEFALQQSVPLIQHYVEPQQQPQQEQDKDENELYKFLFEKSLPSAAAADQQKAVSNPQQHIHQQPNQPQPIDTSSLGTLGNFSKFCDYAPV